MTTETFPSFKGDPNAIRRAVVPLTVMTPRKLENGNEVCDHTCGSATLIDVVKVANGASVGLWLTAAHCLGNDAEWATLAFCDFDGRAPRLSAARVAGVDKVSDLAALIASFPSERDVARPLEISTRPIRRGTWIYRAGWGASAKGDGFTIASGRAVELERVDLSRFATNSALRAIIPKCVGFDGATRPGDSGGAFVDAETGELIGIALGRLGEQTLDSGLSSPVGVCLELRERAAKIDEMKIWFREFYGEGAK